MHCANYFMDLAGNFKVMGYLYQVTYLSKLYSRISKTIISLPANSVKIN